LEVNFINSDNAFKIHYNEDMISDTAVVTSSPGHGGTGGFMGSVFYSSSTALSSSSMGRSTVSETNNTYYLYTYDGRLLAEYDQNGNCFRDYIYSGNRLIAEYKPQTNEYFYYMTDQVNSTRIITNSSGNVVFSEAAGPYGDIQKTWTNTYEPKLKFSGKEREGYSGLDYFGARYFNYKSYRFNSVDPIINREEALYNPQLWNLYAYCENNPITHLDPDGRSHISSTGDTYLILHNQVSPEFAQNWAGEMTQIGLEEAMTYAVSGGVLSVVVKVAKWGKRLLKIRKLKKIKEGIKKARKIAKTKHNIKLKNGKRIDLKGRHPNSKGHYNKTTGEQLKYPHVHDPKAPGGTRKPTVKDYIEISKKK